MEPNLGIHLKNVGINNMTEQEIIKACKELQEALIAKIKYDAEVDKVRREGPKVAEQVKKSKEFLQDFK